MRAVKKRVEVEVIQWDNNWDDVEQFTNHLFRAPTDAERRAQGLLHTCALVFDRLHNAWIPLAEDDYIIRGPQGEFYPVKEDVFEETYDLI